MSESEIADQVVSLAEYYFDKIEEAKSPMDIMGLNWYVQESMINLFKEIYLEKYAH